MKHFYKPEDEMNDGSDLSDYDDYFGAAIHLDDELDDVNDDDGDVNEDIADLDDSDDLIDIYGADSSTDDDENENDSDDSFIDYSTIQRDTSAPTPRLTRSACGTSSSTRAADILNSMQEMDDEEDEVIRKIMIESRKQRNHPPDITTDDFVFDLCFHPYENLLAVGTITGDVVLYKYTNDENTVVSTLEVHNKCVNDIDFSEDGKQLISVSKDRAIMFSDVQTEKLIRFYDEAHENPIYSVKVINENLLATGDDDGMLRVWDLRQNTNKPFFEVKSVEDYISQIITNDDKKLLLMTSGDGYLTTVSIGSRKLYVQTEQYEEEFTCMGLYRNDSKLIVGTSKGRLYSYGWGEFGLHCDMFQGPKTGVNCMVPVTNRIGVFGGEEGVLSAIHCVPGRHLGVVGQHALSVEAIDICSTGEFIASSSHDNDIRFWNIKYFEDFDDIKYNAKQNARKAQRSNLPSSKQTNASDFFSDLAGDDDT